MWGGVRLTRPIEGAFLCCVFLLHLFIVCATLSQVEQPVGLGGLRTGSARDAVPRKKPAAGERDSAFYARNPKGYARST